MTHNIPHFIRKYLAIPDSQWCVLYATHPDDDNRHCAGEHCIDSEELEALENLFAKYHGCYVATNDNGDSGNLGRGRKTPRGRILAALSWMQKQATLTANREQV